MSERYDPYAGFNEFCRQQNERAAWDIMAPQREAETATQLARMEMKINQLAEKLECVLTSLRSSNKPKRS